MRKPHAKHGRKALDPDLLPSFRTNLSMISSKERGRSNVEEQSHRGADDRGAEATGGGAQGGGRGAGSGGIEAHDLRLEGEVWGHERERGAGGQATAGRKHAAEE